MHNALISTPMSPETELSQRPTTRRRVLVVEDDHDIAELIALALQADGYDVSVCHDGGQAMDQVEQFRPDLVLLDVQLPGRDGFDLCQQIRRGQHGQQIGIVMLSARSDDVDIVVGLRLGADDYVAKPFATSVLVARVGAVLRTRTGMTSAAQPNEETPTIIHGLSIYTAQRRVTFEGQELRLSRTCFDLLVLLASRHGWVFSRDKILERLHSDDEIVTERSVDVLVYKLRRQLQDASELIETVHSVGYRLRP